MTPVCEKGSGAQAERLAEAFLVARGLRPVAQNYRTRRGEIDLIMRDGNTLVFVEVRLRSNRSYGDGIDSITAHKRTRIVSAAQAYLQSIDRAPACRFDVVALSSLDAVSIEWIRDAFGEMD